MLCVDLSHMVENFFKTEETFGHPFVDFVSENCENLRSYVNRIREIYYEDYNIEAKFHPDRDKGLIVSLRI